MDLLRALDILSASSADNDNDINSNSNINREKIEACRTIAEQISSPSIRNTSDFPRFLSIAISLLLRVHADKDLNVYSVAEESLNRTIKVLIYTSHERILFELFRVLKGRSSGDRKSSTGSSTTPDVLPTSVLSSPAPSTNYNPSPTTTTTTSSSSSPSPSSNTTNSVLTAANVILSKPFPLKSQRIALSKFGEVCHYIRPSKSRKYMTSLVAPINYLLSLTNDEALQDTIATAMESISRVLISYLKDGDVTQFLQIFMRNLSHHSAAVRRSASFSIVSIVRHYPKSLVNQVIDSLALFLTTNNIEQHHQDTTTYNNNKALGVLFTYLQLLKLSDEKSPQQQQYINIYTQRIDYFLQFIVKYSLTMAMQSFNNNNNNNEQQPSSSSSSSYDHNVVGGGLELLQQLLTSFGKFDYCWPKELLSNIISQLHQLASFNQSIPPTTINSKPLRVGLRAVVINCLAQTVKYFPKIFHLEFYKGLPPPPPPSSSSNNSHHHPHQHHHNHNNLSVSDISFKLFNINQNDNHTKVQSPPAVLAPSSMNQQHLSASTHSLASSTSTLVLDATPKEEYLQYLNDSDPLLRGSTAYLIGCLLKGYLEVDHSKSNNQTIKQEDQSPLLQDYISIPFLMVYLLRSLLDSSSITAKLACTGIGECLGTLSLSRCSEWSLFALRHLLCVTSSTYWLVKLEILDTLSRIDYVVIEYLEQNIQHKSHVLSVANSSATQSNDTGGAVAISIQSKVLGFLIEQLGDNDYRVRHSAGNALVNIIPNLVFTAPLERHSMKGMASVIRDNFDVTNNDNIISKKSKIQSNLSHVISLIISQLSNAHPEDMVRGCYHALKMISSIYSFPLGTPIQCRTLNSTLPNQMLSFVGDILPLALDRVGIITWIATDFDVHLDIIDTLGFLARGAEAVLGGYCHNVLRHLCRMVNIMSNIIQFRPTPPLKETKANNLAASGIVNSPTIIKTSSTHPGAFTHSIHYIKIYAKLLQVRTNSMTILANQGVGAMSEGIMSGGGGGGIGGGIGGGSQGSSSGEGDSDKFSQLRQSCLDTLSVIIKCSGKAVVPYAEEIVSYLTSHFEQETTSATRCLAELFLVCFKPTPLTSMSSSSTTFSSNRLSRDLSNSKIYEPRSVDDQSNTSSSSVRNSHDETFGNSKSVFASFLTMGSPSTVIPPQYYESAERPGLSHSLNYSYSNQEVNRILSSDDKKPLYKLFEPLIASSMLEYRSTHNIELKIEILSLLARLTRFGLDLQLVDKEQLFAPHLLEEIKEQQCLVRQPQHILPYIYDLIGSLFLTRRLFSDIFNQDDIKKLFNNHQINQQPNQPSSSSSSSTISYDISIILKSLHSFSKYLYDVNDKYADQEFRDQFLKFILDHFHLEEAVDLVITILTHIKSNNAIHLKISQVVAQKLFNNLALSETPYFVIESIQSVHRIFALIDRLHPNSVTASRWCDALLSASPNFVASPRSHLLNDPLQRKRPLVTKELLLQYNDIRWLPPLVVLLRTGVKIPEETRISSARQSLYLSYHDSKHAPSPSANIICQLVFKLINNAIQIFDEKKSLDPLPSQLINHLLYFAGPFFNKSLIPTYSPPFFNSSSSPNQPSSFMSSLMNRNNNNTSSNNILGGGLFLSSVRSCVDWQYFEKISTSLFGYGGTSTTLHLVRFLMLVAPSKVIDSWREYAYATQWARCACEHFLTHHVVFLMYCQFAIVHKLPVQLTADSLSFLDKMVLLINEGSIKKLIDDIRVNDNQMNMLTRHLKRIFDHTNNNNSLDLRKKQKLLRLLSYLPTNKETIELLIVNFLQTDDISLQIGAERLLNLHLNKLIDIFGVTDSLVIIQDLYSTFMSNFYKSTTNLSTQSLFIKLIKNLTNQNNQQQQSKSSSSNVDNIDVNQLIESIKLYINQQQQNNQNGSSSLSSSSSLTMIGYDKFIEIVKSQYQMDSHHHAFNQLSILSQIDKDATNQLLLLDSEKLDLTLVPTFITSAHAADFEQPLLQHCIKRLDTLMDNQLNSNPSASVDEISIINNDPLKSGPPILLDTQWDELRELCRTLCCFVNRFGIQGFDEQKLLILTTWSFVEGFKRWRAQVINPYDFKLVLELCRSIISSSQASILTITDDFSWCSLLLCLYKFYCLVIRPHFGFISGQRELEENYSQDPSQISLTQSNEMVKFLVSLLNTRHLYRPTPGSHIGQLIFDSFMASLIPLSSKAIDFIYPTATNNDIIQEEEKELHHHHHHESGEFSTMMMMDEYGGGIIPNCPLFSSSQYAPEFNLSAFVRYINYVGLENDRQFDQIWRILEPIFMAPLGDAEMGSDEITEECKCVALRGITNMIIKTCFETSSGSSGDQISHINLLESATIAHAQYNHTPRDKDLVFLGTQSGRKVSRLQSIIFAALPQSELHYQQQHHQANHVVLSPYHFNIERSWDTDNNRFMSAQLSLSDLRQFRAPIHIGINFSPIVEKLIQTFESFLLNSMCPPQLKKEILNSIVLLSDIYNRDQYTWMYRVCYGILLQQHQLQQQSGDQDANDDFLVKQHLVLAVCKCIAVIYPNDPLQPSNSSPSSSSSSSSNESVNLLFEILKQSLEHANISLQQSALDGILYLLEGKANRYIQGALLQFLFRWIPTRLASQPLPPVALVLRALAVMFIMIEQYSRESEENSFTKKAVLICTTLGQQPLTPLPIVYGIFRGFDRLLVSFSLSHSQREYISHFALKSLPLDNPIRSLLGLGLMVTCMYTGDETAQSVMTPSINANTKNSMMSSPPTTPINYHHSTNSGGGGSSNGSGNNMTTSFGDSPLSFSSSIESYQSYDDYSTTTTNMSDSERQFAQINNMEKVKMLFDKIKLVSHYSYESFILSEVIPIIIVDLYPSVDQILSFILGEFLKQSKCNPKLMCQIVGNVFKLLIEKDSNNRSLVNYWIIICLQNFFQIQNQVHCQWALSFLFLSSSIIPSLQLLSIELSSKIQCSDQIFIIAAIEFYFSSALNQENRKQFIESFQKLKNEPFISLVSLIKSKESLK